MPSLDARGANGPDQLQKGHWASQDSRMPTLLRDVGMAHRSFFGLQYHLTILAAAAPSGAFPTMRTGGEPETQTAAISGEGLKNEN